ncbi:MAG: S41 family peptidase, partial [Solirubrobacterales bacterium]
MRTLITILAIFTALVGGIYIGANPNTPVLGGLKDIVAPDQAEIETDQVQTLIENEFYRKVPEERLTNGSISGMVKSLNDQFSHYFDPDQNKEFAQAISGSYTGVGMAVAQDKRGLLVTLTYPGSPAREGGLKAGDIITEVNGKSIAGESADAAVAKIKGKEGTKVTLTIITPTSKNSKKFGPPRDVVLTRKAIDIPVADGKVYERDGRKIGVVRLISFTETAGELVAEQVEKLKKKGATSWVLDLRGNGGGRLDQAVDVSSIFIKDGMIVATDGRARPRQVYDAIKRDFITPQPL